MKQLSSDLHSAALYAFAKHGQGITPDKNLVPFGRYLLDQGKLHRHGEFSIMHPKSKTKVNATKNAVLSPALKAYFQSYITHEPADTSNLTPAEQEWVKFIWNMAAISKRKPTALVAKRTPYVTKAASKTRVKTLIGEITAGNDNPLLAQELKKLSSSMVTKNWITRDQLAKIHEFLAE